MGAIKCENARWSSTGINTWEQLKQSMRDRFVPSHYQRDLYLKLQSFSQRNLIVDDYYKEMDKMMTRANINELEEATIGHFLSRLNRDIPDVAELHNFQGLHEAL